MCEYHSLFSIPQWMVWQARSLFVVFSELIKKLEDRPKQEQRNFKVEIRGREHGHGPGEVTIFANDKILEDLWQLFRICTIRVMFAEYSEYSQHILFWWTRLENDLRFHAFLFMWCKAIKN